MSGAHLGERVAALVDGELDHVTRDRALAHLAHCLECRAEVEEHRRVKALLAQTATPVPSPAVVAGLLSLADPGPPLPPRARTMPQSPVVPDLPPPGRPPRRRRIDAFGPGRASQTRSRHQTRERHRTRLALAGGLSVVGLVLVTAFAAGAPARTPGGPAVPPVAELSVEHGRTATAVTVGDPGVGLMTGVSASHNDGGVPAPGR